MRWPFSRPAPEADPHPWPRFMAHPLDEDAGAVFTCTTCGRSDLPPAGDWDPPICLECDAAINFDVQDEEGWLRR